MKGHLSDHCNLMWRRGKSRQPQGWKHCIPDSIPFPRGTQHCPCIRHHHGAACVRETATWGSWAGAARRRMAGVHLDADVRCSWVSDHPISQPVVELQWDNARLLTNTNLFTFSRSHCLMMTQYHQLVTQQTMCINETNHAKWCILHQDNYTPNPVYRQ